MDKKYLVNSLKQYTQIEFFQIFPLLITFSVLIYIVLRGVLFVADPDLWGNVRYGQDILKLGFVPQVDPYSYMSGEQKWINHEWLAEVIFAIFYNFAKVPGLLILKTLLVVSISLLLWHSLLKDGFKPIASAVAILIAQVLMIAGFVTMRAHLFTFLCITLELIILKIFTTRQLNKGKSNVILFLPFLFLFWTNCHGGFILGLIVLVVWFFFFVITQTDNWQKHLRQNWPLFMIVLATILITAINPYGIQLWTLLLQTTTVLRSEVSEWQPLELGSVFGAYYLLIIVISILSYVFSNKPKFISLIAIWLLLAYSPLRANRFLPLVSIATVVLVGPHLADCWNRVYAKIKSKTYSYLLFLTAITLFLSFSVLGLLSQLNGELGKANFYIPMPAIPVSILEKTKSNANILAEFNWGHYCIWHLAPRIKVAIDGRRETVYGKKAYATYENFGQADKQWSEILDNFPTDLVLISPNTKVASLLEKKSGWIKLYTDNSSCLFAKEGSKIQKEFTDTISSKSIRTTNENTFP